MEENKNIPTTEGEAIAPEAPVTDIPGTDAPSPDLTAGVPQQEQAGATMTEPGDVVVSFDKIEELMAERRAAARDSWFYGLGFWTRGNAEICLLATRGHPKRQAANVHQFIISPIEAHSKKPDEARDKIVSLMGNLPRVELFARQTPPGWDVWGNEVEPTIRYFGTKCPEVQKGN